MQAKDLKKFPSTKLGINNLPDTPGIYLFKKGRQILYIGKATSLKDRVKSYFTRDILLIRGPKVEKMVGEATRVDYVQTDSVLEAMILEVNEIKKYKPLYNTKEKDDKSYNFVTVTKENFPKVTITRGKGDYGPYPRSSELKEALKIVRKIFPFRDEKCRITSKSKPCFNAQIGLCPGPCAGRITKEEYRKTIRNIKLFFEGKKEMLIKNLEKDMQALAKKQEFEKANMIKRKIFALDHIQDIAMIKHQLTTNNQRPTTFRVEAYDVAHLSGKDVVGVMTVVEDGELNKSQYRKFKIKNDRNDDTKNLQEILERRFNHLEWRSPDLVVVDGGVAQINVARGVTKIPVVAVTKDERHKAKKILGLPTTYNQQSTIEKQILLANAEAHRFAIGYHRKLRNKGFRI